VVFLGYATVTSLIFKKVSSIWLGFGGAPRVSGKYLAFGVHVFSGSP
jgi:hypothetical protein